MSKLSSVTLNDFSCEKAKQKLNIKKPPSQQSVSCDSCNKIFTRKANLEKHLKGACGNVHCKESHEHQIINIQFDSFEEGEAYMTSEELGMYNEELVFWMLDIYGCVN